MGKRIEHDPGRERKGNGEDGKEPGSAHAGQCAKDTQYDGMDNVDLEARAGDASKDLLCPLGVDLNPRQPEEDEEHDGDVQATGNGPGESEDA